MGFLSLVGAEEPDPTAPSPTRRFVHGRGRRGTWPVAPCVAHEFNDTGFSETRIVPNDFAEVIDLDEIGNTE